MEGNGSGVRPINTAEQTDSSTQRSVAEDGVSDVISPLVGGILALCWIALLGGRWLALPLLGGLRLLSSRTLDILDQGLLLTLYLALFAVTLVIVALRLARALESSRTSSGKQGGVSAATPAAESLRPPAAPRPQSGNSASARRSGRRVGRRD